MSTSVSWDVEGDTKQFKGFCRVCPGVVSITLNNSNGHTRLQSWLQRGGTCLECGTWFQASDVIDKYDITGEATQPSNGGMKDYRLERQGFCKDDRNGLSTGIVYKRKKGQN